MKIRFNRLNHVQVCIPRGAEDRARAFYADVLGLKEIEKPEALKPSGGIWFEIADIQLHVGIEDEVTASKRHPAFEVEDIDGVRKYLEEHGVRTRDEPALPSIARFSFFDPFGNRVELMQKIKAKS